MKALAIVRANLTRLTRDRVGLFFLFVFPIILILLLGAAFGGDFTPKVGVVDLAGGPPAQALLADLREGETIALEPYASSTGLEDAVERGEIEGGVVIPKDYGKSLAAGEATIRFVGQADDFAGAVRSQIDAAVARQAALAGAAALVEERGRSFSEGFALARRVEPFAPSVSVANPEGGAPGSDLGRFDLGAASQLVLFTFVNSLAGSVALIQTRLLGVSRRMFSTPTSARSILLGEVGGRFAVAMIQATFIIAAAALLFDVRWGSPPAAALLITAFALVATAAAILGGTTLRNEQQAGALVPLGLGLAALGGCMVPLEVFSPTMRTVAHVTPHAWAVEGFTELIRRDAGVIEVLPQIIVLLLFAGVLLTFAIARLRRSLIS